MERDVITNKKDIDELFLKVVTLVTQARQRVEATVNVAEVYTKFHIGQFYLFYANLIITACQIGDLCFSLSALSSRQGFTVSQGERMD